MCRMYYVYLIGSDPHAAQRYVRFTTGLKKRLAAHNATSHSKI